nr:caspase family protein [Chloroflexaceae bacterium]
MSNPKDSQRRIGSPPKAGAESLFPPGYNASHALIIGINYAGNANHAIRRLANAVADAEAIAACLPRYEFQQIVTLLEENATCDNIRAALDDLTNREQVKENDRIFIFYAGHGEFREVNTRDGKERRGYLIPYDDDGKWPNRIPMDELRTTWEASPAKHVLVILDACYSGLANGRRSATNAISNTDSAVTRYRARQIITAGTSDETIDDLFYSEDGGASRHSYLTHGLVETLQHGSLPQYDTINAETLYEHLRERIVKASNNRQRPTFGNHGHERGVVLLSRPGVNLPGDLYNNLHNNDASQIGAALGDLGRLLETKEQQFQQSDLTEDGIEEWRGLVANEAMRLVREQSDDVVLRQSSRLLQLTLARSARLPAQFLPELVAFLHNGPPARVEQAATMLVQLANSTPTLD